MKLFEKKIKKIMDSIIEKALIEFYEDLVVPTKIIEQNKELLQQLKDCKNQYNTLVLNDNQERHAQGILKLQLESRIHELEDENRKLKEQLYSCGNDKQKLIDEINNLDTKIKELSK